MKTKFLIPFLILLAGCATFHREDLSPSQTASEFESRTLSGAELKKYLEQNLHKEIAPWPPEHWDFAMLELAALYYHPDMDVARARWGVAEAGVITAGARPNPAISLLGQHHSDTPGGVSVWTWGSSLDIPLETAGKRGYRIRKAEHLSEAARLNVATIEWKIRSRLRRNLLALYSSSERERLLKDELAIGRAIAGIFDCRLAAGESSGFEAMRSRVDLEKTSLLLSESRKKKAESRVSLAGAIGLPVDALNGITLSFGLFERQPEAVDPGEARKRALLGRPDIGAALAEYEAAQSALQLEIARQYPDIHIGPGYEWDQGDNKWSLGISLELPVLNRNEGPIKEASARRKEAAAKFRALQASVIGEIDTARASYREALKKLKTADSLVATEEDRMRMITKRFDSGDTDLLDLDLAKLDLSAAGLSRFDALVSAQEELGRLEDALQAPLEREAGFSEDGMTDKKPDTKGVRQ